MTRTEPAYRLLTAAAIVWCALVVSPPLLALTEGTVGASSVVRAFFTPVCHQWSSHSLHLLGAPLAVCARCSAIYLGFLAGVLLAPSIRRGLPVRTTLMVALLPMLLDVALDLAPWYDPGVVSRVLTGSWFGLLAGIVLTPIIVDAVTRLFADPLPRTRTRISP